MIRKRDLDAANMRLALEEGCENLLSKYRALAFYSSVQTWYMFLISKYKLEGKSDLGLCTTTSGLYSDLQQVCDCAVATVTRKILRQHAICTRKSMSASAEAIRRAQHDSCCSPHSSMVPKCHCPSDVHYLNMILQQGQSKT